MQPTAFLDITAGVATLSGANLSPGVTYTFDLLRYAGGPKENFPDVQVRADPGHRGRATWDVAGPVASYLGIIYYNQNAVVTTASAVG